MLTLQQIKQDPQDIIRRLAVKGFDGTEPINRILELDAERRRLQLENDNAAAQLKKHAEAIGALMKSGDRAAAEAKKAEVATLKESQKATSDALAAAEKDIRDILLNVPCPVLAVKAD